MQWLQELLNEVKLHVTFTSSGDLNFDISLNFMSNFIKNDFFAGF